MSDQIVPRLTAEQETEARNLLKRIDEINAESVPLGLAISVFKAQKGHYPSDDLDRYERLINERETLMQYEAIDYLAPALAEIDALRRDLETANARAAQAERERDELREQLAVLDEPDRAINMPLNMISSDWTPQAGGHVRVKLTAGRNYDMTDDRRRVRDERSIGSVDEWDHATYAWKVYFDGRALFFGGHELEPAD